MSALFHPYRHHNRSFGNHHHIVPWSRPSSFGISPFYGRGDADPFGLSQPFLSLFNDTFNQLDRLTSDLDSHLHQSLGSSDPTTWQNLLTSTPKFDVQETPTNYVLEGELPGVAKTDISLIWADDNTLVLNTQTSTVRETKPDTKSDEPSTQSAQTTKSSDPAENPPTEMSETSKSSSTENDSALAKTNASTDVAKPAPATTPMYHLTERTHSTFQRVFSFAGKIKHDDVKASLKNGVLTVTVPKLNPEPAKEEQKTRSVTVEDANETEDAEMVDAEKAKL